MRHWMLLTIVGVSLEVICFLLSKVENHLSYNFKQYEKLEFSYKDSGNISLGQYKT